MKYFRIIGKTLLYVLYFIITIGEREKYMVSKSKGMQCTRIENGLTSFTLYYDKTKKPIRNYLTWGEFRKQHKF